MKNFMGTDGFNWFVGVVEDRLDPKYIGRVKVRCLGYHTPDLTKLPTADLPWATVMNPITSATVSGVGQTPLGLVEGSWVVGFFIDGAEAQQPCVIGSLPGAPNKLPIQGDTVGFQDVLNGNYPREINLPDVNKLAVNATVEVPANVNGVENKLDIIGTDATDGPKGSPEAIARLLRIHSDPTISGAQYQADLIHHLEVVKGFGENTSVADITQATAAFKKNYAKKYGLPSNIFDTKKKIASGAANELTTIVNAVIDKVSGNSNTGSLLKDSILFNAKNELYTPGSLTDVIEADLSPAAAVNFAAGKIQGFNYNDLSTNTLDSFAAKKPSEISGNLISGNLTVADIGANVKTITTKLIQSNPGLSLLTRLSDLATGVPVASVDAVGNIGGGFSNLLAANPLANFAVPGQIASELAGLAEVVSLGQQIGGALGIDTSLLDDVSNIAGTVTGAINTAGNVLNTAGSFTQSITNANAIGTFNNAAGNFSASNLGDAAGVGTNLISSATSSATSYVNDATGRVSTGVGSGFLTTGNSLVNTTAAASGNYSAKNQFITGSGAAGYNLGTNVTSTSSISSIVDGAATTSALGDAAASSYEAIENQIAGVSLDLGTSWSEPPTNADQTQYPFNHVYETEGGHVREYDDTQGFKRIHERHASGSAYEIFDDGTKVTRIKKDQYHLVSANDYVHIKGYANQTLDKGLRVLVNSSGKAGNNYNIQVGKGANVTIQCDKGDINLIAKDGDINMKASGDINMQAGDNMNNLAGKSIFNTAATMTDSIATVLKQNSANHTINTGGFIVNAAATVDITTSIATIVAPARLDLNPISGCFVEGTMIEMADGSEKEITSINVGEKTRGGTVHAKMEFMPQVIYNYKGVLVSGSHWVLEDNQFIAVEDSKHGIITDTIEPVYTFKTSDHRIWIKGIEFGDFETGSDDDWDPHFEAVRQKLNEKLKRENV